MKSYRKELWFNIPSRRGFINITHEIEAAINESGGALFRWDIFEKTGSIGRRGRCDLPWRGKRGNTNICEYNVKEQFTLVNASYLNCE